jgi:hypothetical protein
MLLADVVDTNLRVFALARSSTKERPKALTQTALFLPEQ